MKTRSLSLIDYLVVLGPLLWWGGIASLARVLAESSAAPETGDLWAIIPFLLVGLLLVAISPFRFTDIKTLMTMAFVVMVLVSASVWIWSWGGWAFYLLTAVSVLVIQIILVRELQARGSS